jgi:hypothetical protein
VTIKRSIILEYLTNRNYIHQENKVNAIFIGYSSRNFNDLNDFINLKYQFYIILYLHTAFICFPLLK